MKEPSRGLNNSRTKPDKPEQQQSATEALWLQEESVNEMLPQMRFGVVGGPASPAARTAGSDWLAEGYEMVELTGIEPATS
jgi:hypothetical protein